MTDNNPTRLLRPVLDEEAMSEGGLRAPPGLGPWRKFWWWFDFLILVKLARLRFIAIVVLIGLVIVYWETLTAYYDRWTRPTGKEQQAGSDVEYFCPMHPQIVRDNPNEKCPLCFMPLSRRKKSEGQETALAPGVISRVQLSPYRVLLSGVQTTEVTYLPLSKEISTVGFVEFDERRQAHIAARVKGRIDKLSVNVTGQMVYAGDELAQINIRYSPELLFTLQNLLDAHRRGDKAMQDSNRERLRLWDISDEHVDEVLKTGKVNLPLRIRSPIAGHVVRKYQVEGKYVEEGSPLYDVADLTTVWIQAQVYEDEVALMQEGLAVSATTQAFPDRKFTGRLAFIYPHLDQGTRTLAVRFNMNNPDHALRPGMYVTIKLNVPAGQVGAIGKASIEKWRDSLLIERAAQAVFSPWEGDPVAGVGPLTEMAVRAAFHERGMVLAVPESAVIDTGSRKVVYRQDMPGAFDGVEVHLGPRMVGPEGIAFYPVLRGLEAGERVMTQGSFLIDAETRLNPAAGSIYYGGSSGATSSASSVAAARATGTPVKDDAVKAARAKLRPNDRRLVEAQEFCAVLDKNQLGSMGVPVKVMVKGQPVFLCCEGCKDSALAEPEKTLRKVEQLKGKSRG